MRFIAFSASVLDAPVSSGRESDLLVGDAAAGIDFVDREFGAVARLRTEQRQIAGKCGGQTERD